METKTKVCPRCGIEKDRETEFRHFYDKKRGTKRIQPYCRPCKNEYIREKYHKDKKYREYCKMKAKEVRQSDTHKDRNKAWQKKYRDRIAKEISNVYIRNSCKRVVKPKTPEEYEQARTEILLHRISKKLKDGE